MLFNSCTVYCSHTALSPSTKDEEDVTWRDGETTVAEEEAVEFNHKDDTEESSSLLED